MIRTDNGPQFISKRFTESCQEFGIYHEQIPCRTPNKNAHTEGFNAVLEDECLSRHECIHEEAINVGQARAFIIMLVTVLLGASLVHGGYSTAKKTTALILENLITLWNKTCLSHNANPGNKETQLELGDYEKSQTSPGDYDIYKKFQGMEKSYEGPLPWEGDPKFLKTIKEYDTPMLMAASKATLPDPIQGEAYNIGLAAEQLAGKVVQPGEIFSQNEAIGPYTVNRGYKAGPTYEGNQLVTTVGGGVCKIASLLYNVVTFSDLKVLMRSSHSMTVPYVPPGQDATVYYGVIDFRFLNNTDGPAVIWSQKVDDTLYMALYGRQKPPEVTWHHMIIKRIKYWTEYRYNSNLPPGMEKEAAPGQDGYVVRSWVTVETPDGMITSKKKGTSWYNASPCIIEHGPQKKQ